MRSTWWIGIAVALGGCKGNTKPKPAPVVLDAAVPVAVELVDAGRPWYALPIDASPDAKQLDWSRLPDLGGGDTGDVELLLADAPVGAVLSLFQAPKTMVVGVHDPDARLTGRLTAAKRGDLVAMLHTAKPDLVPLPITRPKGKAPDVDLSFSGAPVRDLFRLFADVERRNYVLAPGTLEDIDIVAKHVPSDAAARAVAAALGLTIDVQGNVACVRGAAQPGLDSALLAISGPTVDIDAHAAHAGEVYAALAALGITIDGGAGCSEGESFDLRLRQVKAGVAVAAIAVASGVAPGATTCTPTPGDRGTITAVHVIAHAGKHATAIIADGTGTGVLDSASLPDGTIGTGYIQGTITDVPMYPLDPTNPAQPGAWLADLAKARLAVVLYDHDQLEAMVELPDGTMHTIKDGTSYVDGNEMYATIGGSSVTITTYPPNGTMVQATLQLQEK